MDRQASVCRAMSLWISLCKMYLYEIEVDSQTEQLVFPEIFVQIK